MRKTTLLILLICISFASCTTKKTVVHTSLLEGTWELNYIMGSSIVFEGLYPDIKPTIIFDMNRVRIGGNNSCNQYFGALLVQGNKINFKDAKIITTMMACPGNAEFTYMDTLNKIESYTITDEGQILNFLIGNVLTMRFKHLK